jgi:hypothetical protein
MQCAIMLFSYRNLKDFKDSMNKGKSMQIIKLGKKPISWNLKI